MELIKVKAKFDMTVTSIIKESLDFSNLTNGESIDILLDNYIDKKDNIEKIHELIEESVFSNWNIEEFSFIENETEVAMIDEKQLEAKTNLIVFVEEMFLEKTKHEVIEELTDEVSFWSNNNMVTVDTFNFVKYE